MAYATLVSLRVLFFFWPSHLMPLLSPPETSRCLWGNNGTLRVLACVAVQGKEKVDGVGTGDTAAAVALSSFDVSLECPSLS